MKITVAESEPEFFQVAASRIVAQIREKRDAVVGLATEFREPDPDLPLVGTDDHI